jgi:hypothetical protein
VPRMVSYDPGTMGYSPQAARARRDLRSLLPDPKFAYFMWHGSGPGIDLGRRSAGQALHLLEEILLQTSCRCSNVRLAMQTGVVTAGSIDGVAMHSPQFSRLVGAGPSPRGRAVDASRRINGSSAS